VQTDESISYVVAVLSGRSVGPPHSEPTGVDASGEPEGRPARRFHSPAGSAPVRPLAAVVWPTAQSDGSDVADVAQQSNATRYVEHASASTSRSRRRCRGREQTGVWTGVMEQPSISSGDVGN